MIAYMHIGERIKILREGAGWTQAELAHRARVSPGYISLLETGERRRISYTILQRIANVFGITVDHLSGPAEGDARAIPGGADLPAPLRRVMDRLGQHVNDEDWEVVASVLEVLAGQRAARRAEVEAIEAERRAAHGYHVPETAEQDSQDGGEKTA